jgi:hypothetical protein
MAEHCTHFACLAKTSSCCFACTLCSSAQNLQIAMSPVQLHTRHNCRSPQTSQGAKLPKVSESAIPQLKQPQAGPSIISIFLLKKMQAIGLPPLLADRIPWFTSRGGRVRADKKNQLCIHFPLIGSCSFIVSHWVNCPCRFDTTFVARIYHCDRMLIQYGKWPIRKDLFINEWVPDEQDVPMPVVFIACICGNDPAMWNALAYILRTQKKMLHDMKNAIVQLMGILQKHLGLYKDVVRFVGQVCFSVLKWHATLESV